MELEIKNEKFGLIATCPISKNMHLFVIIHLIYRQVELQQ